MRYSAVISLSLFSFCLAVDCCWSALLNVTNIERAIQQLSHYRGLWTQVFGILCLLLSSLEDIKLVCPAKFLSSLWMSPNIEGRVSLRTPLQHSSVTVSISSWLYNHMSVQVTNTFDLIDSKLDLFKFSHIFQGVSADTAFHFLLSL